MRITSFINNSKCLEWGLTMQQGALFDLLNQLHTWAEPISIDGEVYYWASKQMICSEIPLAYNKADTVYRALKLLSEKGLINYKKFGEKDCISLTQKGKEWNSEINPTVGNKSEQTRIQIRNSSDSNPTYKNTNNKNTKISSIKKINKKDSSGEDKPKKASQLSDDFQPNDHHAEMAQELNISLNNEFIKFKDYCLANGKKYVDWNAGFNNWLRNAGSFKSSKGTGGQYMTLAERNRKVLESMRT